MASPSSLVDLVEPFGATGSVHGRARRRRAVLAFAARFHDPKGWERASLDEQLLAQPACGRFVAWLIVTGRVRPSVEYLLACRGRLGAPADIVYPHLSAQFDLMGTELGSPPMITRRHWSALILVATASGHRPDRLSTDIIETTLLGFVEAASRCGHVSIRNLSAAVFGMQTVLFHLGLLDAVAPRHNGREGRRAADWDRIAAQAPVLAATMRDYLDQMSVRLRPNSLNSVDTSLRVFAGYLLTDHEEINAVADIRRCHVQAYKTWLASRRGNRGPTLANQTLRERLGALVTFFGRLDELDIVDAPGRSPILRLDLPI